MFSTEETAGFMSLRLIYALELGCYPASKLMAMLVPTQETLPICTANIPLSTTESLNYYDLCLLSPKSRDSLMFCLQMFPLEAWQAFVSFKRLPMSVTSVSSQFLRSSFYFTIPYVHLCTVILFVVAVSYHPRHFAKSI